MSDDDWLAELQRALNEELGRGSGQPSDHAGGQPGGSGTRGTGQFAEQLAGRTLRQFISGSLGGTTERILALDPSGQCVYREIFNSDSGGINPGPEYGTWSASGDFPTGRLYLNLQHQGPSTHVIEYHGGDTCRIDNVVTKVT